MPSRKILSRKDTNLTFLDNVKERPYVRYTIRHTLYYIFSSTPIDSCFMFHDVFHVLSPHIRHPTSDIRHPECLLHSTDCHFYSHQMTSAGALQSVQQEYHALTHKLFGSTGDDWHRQDLYKIEIKNLRECAQHLTAFFLWFYKNDES